MAEGLLRHALVAAQAESDWLIESAGIHALVGEPPARLAIEYASHYGADIRGQRARAFSAEDFARFEEIVAMDRGHLDYLEFMRPTAFAGSIALMRGSPGGSAVEVPDPYGGTRADYAHAARLIADGIGVLLGRRLERRRGGNKAD